MAINRDISYPQPGVDPRFQQPTNQPPQYNTSNFGGGTAVAPIPGYGSASGVNVGGGGFSQPPQGGYGPPRAVPIGGTFNKQPIGPYTQPNAPKPSPGEIAWWQTELSSRDLQNTQWGPGQGPSGAIQKWMPPGPGTGGNSFVSIPQGFDSNNFGGGSGQAPIPPKPGQSPPMTADWLKKHPQGSSRNPELWAKNYANWQRKFKPPARPPSGGGSASSGSGGNGGSAGSTTRRYGTRQWAAIQDKMKGLGGR